VVDIAGVPAGLELESIAWLDASTLAIGTEADRPRGHDEVLIARLEGDGARVVARWTLPWSHWAFTAPPNAGIEGLCTTGNFVVAAGEPVLGDGAARWAPVARMERSGLEAGAWAPFRLRLTSRTGKLSSLDCRLDDSDEIEVYAIERHFGVGRILSFELPTEGDGDEVEATLVIDLAPLMPNLPNLEGISHRGEQLELLTDHDADDPVGDTETIFFGPVDDD
jgi:hypothetical protein